MAPPLSRRFLLQSAMLAAAVPGVSLGTGAGRAVAAAVPTPSTWSVRPFELKDVTLGQGLFADKSRLMLDHGRGYDVDRLLQVFRANAGLSTKGAVAPGGWEGLDGEANGNLRGHYTGHFLTMLAQAYASTGQQVYADKIRTMVDALTEVREALRKDPRMLAVTGKWGGAHENVRGSYQYVDLPAAVLGALFGAAAYRPLKYFMAIPATSVFLALVLAAYGARRARASKPIPHATSLSSQAPSLTEPSG